MQMMIAVIILAVLCLLMLIVALRRTPPAADRLQAAMREGGFVLPGSELDDSLHGSALRRGVIGLLHQVHGWLERTAPPRILEAAQMTMERIGHTTRRATAAYLVIKAILIATAIVGTMWSLLFFHGTPMQRGALALVVIIVTLIAPAALLSGQIRGRQEEIRRALPDVIDLLAVSAEAGMGLDGAIAIVIRRKPGPLSDELDRMLLEMRLGASRQEAWSRLVFRVNMPELKVFVASLQDAEEMGVSIADTLRAQSDALRVKRSMLVRQLAATLPIKMLFPLIFCIMPALFAILLGPGLIAVFRAFSGLPQ